MATVKITFLNFTTKELYPLDNPTKENALEQAILVSSENPECIFLLRIITTSGVDVTVEEWRLRAGVVIFHVIIPDPSNPNKPVRAHL